MILIDQVSADTILKRTTKHYTEEIRLQVNS